MVAPPTHPQFRPPALGVGLVYWQALEPLFAPGGPVQVLELEPQTLWTRQACGGGWQYVVNTGLLEQVAALPQAKLMHGVGHPLGGLHDDHCDWVTPWRQCAQALAPRWASEHLSFNRFRHPRHGLAQTSFLLPPRQTPAGVRLAARNIARLRQASGVPVAFETGVNYLQPRADEPADGDYFRAVAESAGCGIVLDLHNLWANQRNGRWPLEALLDRLPLERVWEVHLAGGSALDGYWLDAHDGLCDEALLALAADVMPRLPNLGALVFEVLPQYVSGIGLDRIARQLEDLQQLWRLCLPARAEAVAPPGRAAAARVVASSASAGGCDRGHPRGDALVGDVDGDGDGGEVDERGDDAELAAWETELGLLALGQAAERATAAPRDFGLARDPGIAIFEQLVREFRCGRIVRVMRYTTLVLLRGLGLAATDALMRDYCRCSRSDIFTAHEATHFADYLSGRIQDGTLALPWLDEVLAFEHALVRAAVHGEGCRLQWSVDPVQLFAALEAGHDPAALPRRMLVMGVDLKGDAQFVD